MKKVIAILTLVLMSSIMWGQCPTPELLDKSAALGTWKGAYSSEGQFINFIIKIKEKDGELSASIDIPSVKEKDIQYQARICDGQELHITRTTGSTTIEFVGTPKKGTTMNGRVLYKENTNVTRQEVFTANRVSKKTASTSTENPAIRFGQDLYDVYDKLFRDLFYNIGTSKTIASN